MRRWSTKQIGRTLILQFLKLIFVAWEMCTFCFWSILALLLLNYNKLFLFWNVIKLTIQSNSIFFKKKIHYIIFGSKHMWRFFSICGSYVMQVVRHLVVYRCWARKQNMSVFFVGWGWMFQSWVNYLLDCFSNVWGMHTSMMHGQDLHGWSLIPPKSFIWLSFKTCGLKILDCMDIGILGMLLTIYVSPKKKTFQNGDHQNTCIHNIKITKCIGSNFNDCQKTHA